MVELAECGVVSLTGAAYSSRRDDTPGDGCHGLCVGDAVAKAKMVARTFRLEVD